MLRNSVFSTQRPKISFARRLRKTLTPGEKALWRKLRAQQFHGFKFRRQVPLGPYIVDFLCVEKKIIIEIDGDSHFEPGAQKRDEKRELYLRSLGFEVLRFENRRAVHQVDLVLTAIGRVFGVSKD